MSRFDSSSLRRSIPALAQEREGRRLLFADNAATSLKPESVIDAVVDYYTGPCANVHRGVHLLAEEADRRYEAARESVAELIGARRDEVVFVRNTTEANHLAAHLLDLGPDDEVVASHVDHHSNLLPWQRGALRLVEPTRNGCLVPESFARAISERTRLVAVGHASNVTGWVAPLQQIVRAVRAVKPEVKIVVDAAQSIAHLPVDVGELDCDLLAFSGHKMMAPSGIGVLFARRELLADAPPLITGGGMVRRVGAGAEDFDAAEPPHRFEAGTPNIEGALGLGAAAELLLDLGMDEVAEHGRHLSDLLDHQLATVPRLRIVPLSDTASDESTDGPGRLPIRSFSLGDLSADQVAEILSQRHGILVASGVHCAEPLARYWGYDALVRISLHPYNTEEEVERLGAALRSLAAVFH